jgi:hypothetical protein
MGAMGGRQWGVGFDNSNPNATDGCTRCDDADFTDTLSCN